MSSEGLSEGLFDRAISVIQQHIEKIHRYEFWIAVCSLALSLVNAVVFIASETAWLEQRPWAIWLVLATFPLMLLLILQMRAATFRMFFRELLDKLSTLPLESFTSLENDTLVRFLSFPILRRVHRKDVAYTTLLKSLKSRASDEPP